MICPQCKHRFTTKRRKRASSNGAGRDPGPPPPTVLPDGSVKQYEWWGDKERRALLAHGDWRGRIDGQEVHLCPNPRNGEPTPHPPACPCGYCVRQQARELRGTVPIALWEPDPMGAFVAALRER